MKWCFEMFEADRKVGSARFCHCCKGEASPRSVTSLVVSEYRLDNSVLYRKLKMRRSLVEIEVER